MKTVATPSPARPGPPVAVTGDGRGVRAGGVRRRRRAAAEPLDARPHVVAVGAHDRAGRAPSPPPRTGRGRRRRSGRAGRRPAARARPRRSCGGCRRRRAAPRCAGSGARPSRRRRPGSARPGAGRRSSPAARRRASSYALVPAAQSAFIVTTARSRSSSRSRAGGKAMPYAACSRSNHPAPMPTKARPPVSADSVAAAFAVTPAGRKVTGVQRVPSSSPVPAAAIAPRATHGSGIGSHARPTWGTWMRWSISASPAKPASSAARATSVSQASGSSPHGKRDTCRTDRRPRLEVRSRAVRVGRGAGAGRASARRPQRPRPRGPSPRRPAAGRTSRTERSCPASAGAGTGRSRAALRRRHSASGVSRRTATAGSPAARAAAPSQALPLRRVETEGVHDRGQAAAEPGGDDRLEDGERVGRGVEVVRAAAQDAAQGVGGDDLLVAVAGGRPRRLAGPRGADEHHEGRVGESHPPSLAYVRGPSSPARRAAGRRRRTPRRRRT